MLLSKIVALSPVNNLFGELDCHSNDESSVSGPSFNFQPPVDPYLNRFSNNFCGSSVVHSQDNQLKRLARQLFFNNVELRIQQVLPNNAENAMTISDIANFIRLDSVKSSRKILLIRHILGEKLGLPINGHTRGNIDFSPKFWVKQGSIVGHIFRREPPTGIQQNSLPISRLGYSSLDFNSRKLVLPPNDQLNTDGMPSCFGNIGSNNWGASPQNTLNGMPVLDATSLLYPDSGQIPINRASVISDPLNGASTHTSYASGYTPEDRFLDSDQDSNDCSHNSEVQGLDSDLGSNDCSHSPEIHYLDSDQDSGPEPNTLPSFPGQKQLKFRSTESKIQNSNIRKERRKYLISILTTDKTKPESAAQIKDKIGNNIPMDNGTPLFSKENMYNQIEFSLRRKNNQVDRSVTVKATKIDQKCGFYKKIEDTMVTVYKVEKMRTKPRKKYTYKKTSGANRSSLSNHL